jgi:polysaccharide export outer membrane protein
VALRRFDIVYVPRTNIAEAGVFMEQWVNNLIPGGILNYFTYRTFGN